jgi:hypothetical protein
MKQTALEQTFALPGEDKKSNPFRYVGYLFVSPLMVLFLCFVLLPL